MSMEWPQLLCPDRLGNKRTGAPDPARPPYTIDSDRIIFCSAFRRLQDKTQVFPLSDNDFVRTRLTHSLEVASVGRSLGARVGAAIVEKHGLSPDYHASDFGAIVSAAALAHDLGNPPFGHSGEDAIQHWFVQSKVTEDIKQELTDLQRADVEKFEGNAQGFRVIVRLQMPDNPGLRLTCATLAAFSKYPRESLLPANISGGVSLKKFGFFQSEREFFAEVAAKTGMIPREGNAACWHRHPLAFLVEAADDICYRLVDFEDGFRLKHLDYAEVFEAFLAVSGDSRDRDRAARMRDEKERIAFLRAKAIGAAIEQTAEAFLQKEESILRGAFDQELLDFIPCGDALRAIKDESKKTIYSTIRGVEIEVAGYEVLGGLLDVFFGALEDIARQGGDASMRSRKLLRLVPGQFLGPGGRPDEAPALRLMKMLDFVSGMTDSYAVSLYKKVRGISLPGT
jgi:dGTPase